MNLTYLTKNELLIKCSNLQLTKFKSKTKDELINLLQKHIIPEPNISSYNKLYNDVLKELKTKIKNKLIVCSGCNEIGHKINSDKCPININKTNILKLKIKEYVLTNSINDNNDDSFQKHATLLNITLNKYKTIYYDIPLDDILNNQKINDSAIDDLLLTTKFICPTCNDIIYNFYVSGRTWKGDKMCNSCWLKFEEDRTTLWYKINSNKKQYCNICNKEKKIKNDRFHYDHINMFIKYDSVCNMVNNGEELERILEEINKCKLVCISCHSLITKIETKFSFIRTKTILTRKLNSNELTNEQYLSELEKYNKIYKEKMEDVYIKLKQKLYINK